MPFITPSGSRAAAGGRFVRSDSLMATDPLTAQAVLFFAFFILTDPPTSPVKYRDQVVCALIVAGVSYVVFELVGAVSYLLIAVLAGNLWEAWRRSRAHVRKQHDRAALRAGHV